MFSWRPGKSVIVMVVVEPSSIVRTSLTAQSGSSGSIASTSLALISAKISPSRSDDGRSIKVALSSCHAQSTGRNTIQNQEMTEKTRTTNKYAFWQTGRQTDSQIRTYTMAVFKSPTILVLHRGASIDLTIRTSNETIIGPSHYSQSNVSQPVNMKIKK